LNPGFNGEVLKIFTEIPKLSHSFEIDVLQDDRKLIISRTCKGKYVGEYHDCSSLSHGHITHGSFVFKSKAENHVIAMANLNITRLET
jgi:hypothetical protein